MKKKIIGLFAFLLAFVILVTGFISAAVGSANAGDIERKKRLYSELSESQWNVVDENGKISIPFSEVTINETVIPSENITLKKDEILKFAIPENGFADYKIGFKYRIPAEYSIDVVFDVSLDSEASVAYLPKIWTDENIIFKTDKKGNEVESSQIGTERFVFGFLSDYQTPGMQEIVFSKSAGTVVTIKSQYASVEIEEIFIYEYSETVSYSEYKKENSVNLDAVGKNTRIEAEEYSVKSASSIHGSNLNSIKVYPYNTYKRLINVIEGSYWSQPSQKVMWEFEIEKTGWYNIGFRYTQSGEANKSSYRTIEIDGKTPFSEFEDIAFESTNSSYEFKNIYLSDKDGNNYKVYLTEGTHTIALKNSIGDLAEVYYELKAIMTELNDVGLDLQRLTAGTTDANRTWDLELYMPDAVGEIKALQKRIDAAYEKLSEIEGAEASYANNLIFASEQIDKLLENVRTIPNNTELLNVGDESATKYVGTVLTKLVSQPLTLDCIYVSGDDGFDNLSGGFFATVKDALIKFCYSYIREEETEFDSEKTKVTVWMSRNMQYVQMLQQLINEGSDELEGLEIDLSVMQDKQKLVLANASGSNPDVVLSVAKDTPFEFAIRNAAKDFTDYEDFEDFYLSQYSLENLVPSTVNGGVYGLTETMDCKLLYYRTDIFEKLNLKVPDTWDDVKQMMTVLLGNSYNFYIPLGSSAGFKDYEVTLPFITQNGGTFFAEDGLSTTIGSENTVNGLKEMTDIFTIYSLQKTVPSFYNSFRYGEIPIGISGLGTYIQLLVAAPELNGLWDVAVTPGTVQADGSIKRYQTAASTSCMIFENTKVSNESWQFVKWWLSKDTQLDYAQSMERIYGTSYRYNTANLAAFAELEYPEKVKSVIFEQLEHQKETTRHPANYMVEREISNIWTSVVVDGENLQETVDRAIITVNREIDRKMQEYGYIDSEGNSVKTYSNSLEFLNGEENDAE